MTRLNVKSELLSVWLERICLYFRHVSLFGYRQGTSLALVKPTSDVGLEDGDRLTEGPHSSKISTKELFSIRPCAYVKSITHSQIQNLQKLISIGFYMIAVAIRSVNAIDFLMMKVHCIRNKEFSISVKS